MSKASQFMDQKNPRSAALPEDAQLLQYGYCCTGKFFVNGSKSRQRWSHQIATSGWYSARAEKTRHDNGIKAY